MCQSDLYAIDTGQQELLLEDVARVQIQGEELTVEPIFGEPIFLNARIKDIDLMKHRIVVERI